MKPEIITQLTCKWGVQTKQVGYSAEDYFASDDYRTTKDAYELACRNLGGKDLEWVALFAKGRMTSEGWVVPHIRLLDDRRQNNDPISSALAGFINSIPGGSI